MYLDPLVERFAAEVGRGEDLDLGRSALLVALFARPRLDVEAYLKRLDLLADAARARGLGPVATIASLYGEDGLRGNSDHYYDPRNSFLHEVLDRRLGIPISLSVVAIEVGRRAGIDVEGVPFPGHFLVRVHDTPGQGVLLDPFGGGGPVSDAELLLRLRAATGRIGALGPEELGRASRGQILARMLQNLKAIYLKADDLKNALAVQERMVVLKPEELVEVRDRGLLYARLGRDIEAEADLRTYLEGTPGAADTDAVRAVADHLRARRGPPN